MKRIVSILVLALGAGCGPKASSGNTRDRYRAAVDAKLAGDGARYYRELVALAHDAPDTREGRRARATLTGGDLFTTIATTGVLAAIAIPNFMKYQQRARQTEAPANLKIIGAWEAEQKKKTGRYSDALPAGSIAGPRYYYFLSPGAPVAGPTQTSGLGGADAAAGIASLRLEPGATTKHFFAVAVANLDGDEVLDVWTIDDGGAVVHLVDDLD